MLLRNHYLSNISEGLSSEEGKNHPIKTFLNVSSGPVKSGDKIIITSQEIFKIFSETEIKKNAERFPPEKFSQFLKTALLEIEEISLLLKPFLPNTSQLISEQFNGLIKLKKPLFPRLK